MGVMQAARVLETLAVGGTGVVWWIAGGEGGKGEWGVWAVLVVVGAGGAVGGFLVRERARVVEFEEGEGLMWEVCYDEEVERVWGSYEGRK